MPLVLHRRALQCDELSGPSVCNLEQAPPCEAINCKLCCPPRLKSWYRTALRHALSQQISRNSNLATHRQPTKVFKVGVAGDGCLALNAAENQHCHIGVHEEHQDQQSSNVVESRQRDDQGSQQCFQALQNHVHTVQCQKACYKATMHAIVQRSFN